MPGGADTARLAMRFGLQVSFNGADEYAHLIDASITPANSFDFGVSSFMSVGCLFQRGYASVNRRQFLMGKRDSDDSIAGTDGWYLELDVDNRLRWLLDDGTNLVEVHPTEEFTLEGFGQIVVLTLDLIANEAKLYASTGRQPQGVRLLATVDASALGSCDNTERFTLGAWDDGTASPDHFYEGSMQWAAVWNETLPLQFIRGGLARFDLPFPDDSRIVSCWHFTNQDFVDWKEGNGNDLQQVGIPNQGTNYGPGIERFPVVDAYDVKPSAGETPGTANFSFFKFRPDPLQEAFFKFLGQASAPPMRVRRTTNGAVDPPFWQTLTGFVFIKGRYGFVEERPGLAHILRVYDARVGEDFFETDTPIEGWEALGEIDLGTPGEPSNYPDTDVDGVPSFLYFKGSLSGNFHVLDITDPTSPSLVGTLSDPQILFSHGIQTDLRGNGIVWAFSDGGILTGVDVNTPAAPTLHADLTESTFDSVVDQQLIQIGTDLYMNNTVGITVVDISTSSAPVFRGRFENTPSAPRDVTTDLLPFFLDTMLTYGQSGSAPEGVIHTWDISDPDAPFVLNRFSSPLLSNPRNFHRIGTTIFCWTFPGAAQAVVMLDFSDPLNPGIIAQYTMADYFPGGGSGVQGNVAFDRDQMLYSGNSAGQQAAIVKFDGGEGFSNLEINFPKQPVVIASPVQEVEHASYLHDLSDLDFEDDVPGTDPPTGWFKTGVDTFEVSDVRGLTGGVDGTLPQSVLVVGAGGDSGGFRDFSITGADLFFGKEYMLTFAHLVRGSGGFDAATDFEVRIGEFGGVLNNTETFRLSASGKDRWHANEFRYRLRFLDSSILRITLITDNTPSEDIYIDSFRLGEARSPLLFAGRCLKVTGNSEEPEAEALFWDAEFIDKTWDLNRLTVNTSLPSQLASVSLASLFTEFTRGQDSFDGVTNIYEVGVHEAIPLQNQGNLAQAITRVVENGQALWWMDYFGVLWAMPPNFYLSPVFMNDQDFGWFDFTDSVDGVQIVTEGTIEGDQSAVPVPQSTFSASETLRRYGVIEHFFPPTGDISTDAGADDLSAFFLGLFGDLQYEGSASFKNQQLIRPGMLIPVQIAVRQLDRLFQVSGVGHTSPGGGRLVSSVQFATLLEDLAGLLSRGSRGGTQDIGTMGFDNPEFGFDNEPALAFDAVS